MNGKGSAPRGQSKEERKRFEDGWLRGFSGTTRKRRNAKKNTKK